MQIPYQDAMMPERFIEGGTMYVLSPDDADIYRKPFLESGDSGEVLMETCKAYAIAHVHSEVILANAH